MELTQGHPLVIRLMASAVWQESNGDIGNEGAWRSVVKDFAGRVEEHGSKRLDNYDSIPVLAYQQSCERLVARTDKLRHLLSVLTCFLPVRPTPVAAVRAVWAQGVPESRRGAAKCFDAILIELEQASVVTLSTFERGSLRGCNRGAGHSSSAQMQCCLPVYGARALSIHGSLPDACFRLFRQSRVNVRVNFAESQPR